MSKQTYIQKKIVSILKENTGGHFLDSGGIYGRHWERNQKRKISFHEDITISDYGCSIPIQVFMDTMFETNDMTRAFNRLLTDYYWTGEAIERIEDYFALDDCNYGGDNTYNFDNDLSQDFQYEIFKYHGDYYCIFQLHNGCDARGGYTKSQVFSIKDIDYFYCGMKADFYDNSNDEQFESYWSIADDERYELDEDKGCFINKETNEEVYPYSSAMGF